MNRTGVVDRGHQTHAAALHRKLREGVFSEAVFREVIAQFEDDCSRDLWTWIPLTAMLVAATGAVIRRVPKSVFIRGVDAIHLACACESGFTEVYTADRHMALAAPHFSVRPRTGRWPPPSAGVSIARGKITR